MKTLLITLAVVLATPGCTSLNPNPEYYKAEASRVNAEAIIKARPMWAIKCTAGCEVQRFDTTMTSKVEQGYGTAHLVRDVSKNIVDLGKFGIGGLVVSRALREVGEKTYNINANGENSQVDFRKDTIESQVNDTTSGDSSNDTTITEDNDTTNTQDNDTTITEDNDTTTTTTTEAVTVIEPTVVPPVTIIQPVVTP